MHRPSASWTLRALILALIAATPMPAAAQTVVPLAPFRSVTLHDGGEVILRHGPTQRVTVLQGSTSTTDVAVDGQGRLVIIRCRDRCPKGYELVLEVETPEIAGITVTDGGTILSRGSFPRQAELEVAVADGGTIDLRSMTAGVVAAAVQSGGRIFIRPVDALEASIARGGAITYWGNPHVSSSIEQGGVVARGRAADADRPLTELHLKPELTPAVPALPPLPPVPVRETRFWM